MISKWAFYILIVGILLGSILGGIAVYVEWDLNPQMEYTLNPEGLIWVFCSVAAIVSFPFSLVAAVIEIIKLQHK